MIFGTLTLYDEDYQNKRKDKIVSVHVDKHAAQKATIAEQKQHNLMTWSSLDYLVYLNKLRQCGFNEESKVIVKSSSNNSIGTIKNFRQYNTDTISFVGESPVCINVSFNTGTLLYYRKEELTLIEDTKC